MGFWSIDKIYMYTWYKIYAGADYGVDGKEFVHRTNCCFRTGSATDGRNNRPAATKNHLFEWISVLKTLADNNNPSLPRSSSIHPLPPVNIRIINVTFGELFTRHVRLAERHNFIKIAQCDRWRRRLIIGYPFNWFIKYINGQYRLKKKKKIHVTNNISN